MNRIEDDTFNNSSIIASIRCRGNMLPSPCLATKNSHSAGWSPNWVPSTCRPLLAYCTCPGWLWGWRIWWNKHWQRKPEYSKKTCPRATLSTTNSTWPEPGANPGRRGGKPATNRLSYDAACLVTKLGIHTQTHRLMGGVYEVHRWDGLRCQVS
jgi:hypothetical protein